MGSVTRERGLMWGAAFLSQAQPSSGVVNMYPKPRHHWEGTTGLQGNYVSQSDLSPGPA